MIFDFIILHNLSSDFCKSESYFSLSKKFKNQDYLFQRERVGGDILWNENDSKLSKYYK